MDNEVWLHVKDHRGLGRARSSRTTTRDAHTNLFIHTWHVKHRDVHKVTDGTLNHHRRRHRGASLIFPNAERDRRDHKLPFNDRAPGSRRIAPRPIHRDVASILNYVREDDPRLSTLSEMRELRIESRTETSSPSPQSYAQPHALHCRVWARMHVHACDTGVDCLVIEWLTAGRAVTRERRNREEKCAGRGTTSLSFTLWR